MKRMKIEVVLDMEDIIADNLEANEDVLWDNLEDSFYDAAGESGTIVHRSVHEVDDDYLP